MPDQSSAADEHAIIQEITAPLETLPDDPLALVEAEFPTAMRGYDRHVVDDYVQRTRRLVAELAATRSPEAAVRRALERVGDQISGILQRAHETAEQITAQSRREAEDRLQEARRDARQLVSAAENRVRELDADTDRIWSERQRIVADAEELSAQLLSVAREAVDRFPDEGEGEGPEDEGPSGAEETAAAPVAAPAGVFDEGDEEGDEGDEGDDPLGQAIEQEQAPPLADEFDAPQPDPGIERTVAFEPPPRRLTDDDSTHVIPPASEAANRRRDP